MSFKTVFWSKGAVVLLDQRKLPLQEEYLHCTTVEALAEAIKNLSVRGAPAIGIAAALGISLAGYQSSATEREGLVRDLEAAAALLRATRPTAVNLFWGIEQMLQAGNSFTGTLPQLKDYLLTKALQLLEEDYEMCLAIGNFGSTLVAPHAKILTHCNAGGLATAGYGTAVGVLRTAHQQGKEISVWVDETRPLLQGARLTAWELQEAGIPYKIITDNMAGYVMSRGAVDAVITGADRVLACGDTANKIGTYSLAVLARYHNIPFYIAAPFSTIEFTTRCGADIVIEERTQSEILECSGSRITPHGAQAFNPAFDVTPGNLISAIITDRGIAYPPYSESLSRLLRPDAMEVKPGS